MNKESNDRLKCQIYPSMQLGGTPPQLFDQARDGVADIVWTVPTYSAGRFSKSEVFELPMMTVTAKAGSQAFWDYVQKNSLDEFKGTSPPTRPAPPIGLVPPSTAARMVTSR